MPLRPEDTPPLRCVLDRLIDLDPGAMREVPPSANELHDELRRSVRRDVENLLNTRQRCLSWPEELRTLDDSLVGYGIPDMTGRNLATSKARSRFFESVESVLRKFEPRFKSVKVVPVEEGDPIERTLRFRIEALVHANPEPEHINFDSRMEPIRRSFQVAL